MAPARTQREVQLSNEEAALRLAASAAGFFFSSPQVASGRLVEKKVGLLAPLSPQPPKEREPPEQFIFSPAGLHALFFFSSHFARVNKSCGGHILQWSFCCGGYDWEQRPWGGEWVGGVSPESRFTIAWLSCDPPSPCLLCLVYEKLV